VLKTEKVNQPEPRKTAGDIVEVGSSKKKHREQKNHPGDICIGRGKKMLLRREDKPNSRVTKSTKNTK